MAEKPSIYAMHAAPRCGAKTRRGTPVSHPRWPTDDAGCTAGSCPGRRAETATPGSMAYTARRKKRKRKEAHALIREMRSLMRELGA